MNRFIVGIAILGMLRTGMVEAQDRKGDPQLVLDLGGHSRMVTGLVFNRDGTQLISVSLDRTIRIWDTPTGQAIRTFHLPFSADFSGELYAVALAPDGE